MSKTTPHFGIARLQFTQQNHRACDALLKVAPLCQNRSHTCMCTCDKSSKLYSDTHIVYLFTYPELICPLVYSLLEACECVHKCVHACTHITICIYTSDQLHHMHCKSYITYIRYRNMHYVHYIHTYQKNHAYPRRTPTNKHTCTHTYIHAYIHA